MGKKLQESFHRIMSLEEKVKKYEEEKRNQSAINLRYGVNKSELLDKQNLTEFENG